MSIFENGAFYHYEFFLNGGRHRGSRRKGVLVNAGEIETAVLQAVAIEAYRSGRITLARVQQMLGCVHDGRRTPFCSAPKRITTTRWMS